MRSFIEDAGCQKFLTPRIYILPVGRSPSDLCLSGTKLPSPVAVIRTSMQSVSFLLLQLKGPLFIVIIRIDH